MEPESPEANGIIEFVQLYKLPIVLGGLSLLTIVISIILLVKSTQSAAPIQFSDTQNASPSGVLGTSTIKVDIEGAIIHPGLYSVPEGSRVEDVLAAAGGLAKDVDEIQFAKTINRAMKLVDGGKLYIPSVTDASVPGASVQSDQNGGLISINSATESQLDGLPGVGPVTAQKIIANRPYQTLEELVSKKSVGSALFEKIKNQLSL